MPEFKRVRLANGFERTVSRVTEDMTVLDKPAVDRRGRPLPEKPYVDLRGAELDKALEGAGLPKSGTAEEKRERLAAHQTGDAGTTTKEK